MFGNLFKGAAPRITANYAKAQMYEDRNIVLLDVRTSTEHTQKRINGSINIPLDSISSVEKKIRDKETKVFVYCQSGGRAGTACRELIKMGYKSVYDLGGIMNWPFETIIGKE